MEFTLKDYQEKKFFITPDFNTYRYNLKGQIEDLGSIDNDSLEQICDYIKEQIFNEVNRVADEWKGKFIAECQINYDKEHFQKAELKTVNQILRGKKNTIIDSFGITHEIISYLNGKAVLFSDGIRLRLSPVFSLERITINEIRRYMVFKYNVPKPFYEYIQNPIYGNLSEACILPEVLIKYHGFLSDYSTKSKSERNKDVFTLEKACNGSKEYDDIRAWFIQNNFCDPDTFILKDRKSGYRKVLAQILKDLNMRGYAKELTDNEVLNIAQNSFGVKMGISLIQHIRADGTSKIPTFK